MPEISLRAFSPAVPSAQKEASPFPRAQEPPPPGSFPCSTYSLPRSFLSLQNLGSHQVWTTPMSSATPGGRGSLKTETSLDTDTWKGVPTELRHWAGGAREAAPAHKHLGKPPRDFISGRQEGQASSASTHSSTCTHALTLLTEAPSCPAQICPLTSSLAIRDWAELSSPALLASPWPFPGPAWGCQDPQQVLGQTWGSREGLGAADQPLAKNRAHRETSSKIFLFLILPTSFSVLLITTATIYWMLIVCLTL